MINTITLAMKFYNQPDFYTKILDVLNIVFSVVFALEFVFKLAAFRFKVSFLKFCFVLLLLSIKNQAKSDATVIS